MKKSHKDQEIVLMSACLLGIRCRYNGKHAYNKKALLAAKGKHIIFACPEQLGGLTTPRSPNIIQKDRVITADGHDVTGNFYRGAREFLKIARKFRVKILILKSRSPSCGRKGIVSKLMTDNYYKVRYMR